MTRRLTFNRLSELLNKVESGDLQAKAELDSYAKEYGYESWDEYWQSTMDTLRDGFSRIGQTAATQIHNLGNNVNAFLNKFWSDIQVLVEYYEKDPAFQALIKRSEEPSILADPVLSVAMEYLDDIDIGELLEKIREKQGNPSPITLEPIIIDSHRYSGQSDAAGKKETRLIDWGTIPKRSAELDRWRIVWRYIKKWVMENGWKTEKILEMLKAEKRYNKYTGPLVHRDTLYKIIKAGKSGELESQ